MSPFVCVRNIFLLLLLAGPATVSRGADPPTEKIDVCKAMKISEERLGELVAEEVKRGLPGISLSLICRNAKDECLVNSKVKVTWEGGSETHTVPWTGTLVLRLTQVKTKGLTLNVPSGFVKLSQTTFPEGANYQPPADFKYFDFDVTNDREIEAMLLRKLVEIREQHRHVAMPVLVEQLQRKQCSLELPGKSRRSVEPKNSYPELKRSVVIVAGLSKQGQTQAATGVIIAPKGIRAIARRGHGPTIA